MLDRDRLSCWVKKAFDKPYPIPHFARAMSAQAKQTVVVTSHQNRTITIDGRMRRCYPRPGPEGGIDWKCRLSHADVLALGAEIPCPSRNYELINGQYVRELASDRYWPIAALPEICPDSTLADETSLVTPLAREPKPAKPRTYAGRRPRGLSQRYGPLVNAVRDMLPLLPPDHPVARAMARLDAMRKQEIDPSGD